MKVFIKSIYVLVYKCMSIEMYSMSIFIIFQKDNSHITLTS